MLKKKAIFIFVALFLMIIQIKSEVTAQSFEASIPGNFKVFIPMVAIFKPSETPAPTAVPTATIVPTPSVTPTITPTIVVENCPSTPAEMASVVGGLPNMWTPPSWAQGAWTFTSDGSFYTLTVPSYSTLSSWIDFWNGSISGPDRLDEGESLSLSDASFHCQ